MDSGAGANNSSDFVRKLYKMLENSSDESVVRWGNDGDSFVVLENEKFTKNILPKHFKHSNFASFVRQLNKYDFHKVRHNNEETGQSPYGAGAWEFRHPDFKMNNKDALDNIRRKAPAPRKPNQGNDEYGVTQQVDMFSVQLVATQQQLQQLQQRYDELSIHHSMLLTEIMGLQKTVVNHEHVMQNVMSFLHSVDAQRRRDSRVGNPFQTPGPPEQNGASTNGPTHQQVQPPMEDDTPASPLQNATKLLSETNVDQLINPRNIEHMNELTMRMNGTLTTPPPDARHITRPSSRDPPHSASSSNSMRIGDLDNMVYPVGLSNGIDPTYAEHAQNIPYAMPPKAPEPASAPAPPAARKKSQQYDPGWIRQPQVLLVEDDPTCRRIGAKFLHAFNCNIDSALDGLEAVNKMNAGSKYDLVLMDIIMPNLDGVSACHLIRQFDSTPIIAMTSNIRSDDIAMYFQHGMNDVLPKPFTKEGLLLVLDKHLAHLKRGDFAHSSAAMGAPPVQPLAHTSASQSIKDDHSPSKSPATASNWNSPGVSGVSPSTSNMTDDYMGAVQAQAGPYAAMQPGMPTTPGIPTGYTTSQAMGVQANRGQPHRRQISDISGGPDDQQQIKRQQMYGQPPMQQQQMNPMHRPR